MNWRLIILFSVVNVVAGTISGFISTVVFELTLGIDKNIDAFAFIQLIFSIALALVIYGFLGYLQKENPYWHASYVFLISFMLGGFALYLITGSVSLVISTLIPGLLLFIVALAGVAIGGKIRTKRSYN